jgi:hypothetical protein
LDKLDFWKKIFGFALAGGGFIPKRHLLASEIRLESWVIFENKAFSTGG